MLLEKRVRATPFLFLSLSLVWIERASSIYTFEFTSRTKARHAMSPYTLMCIRTTFPSSVAPSLLRSRLLTDKLVLDVDGL